ncbi:MAG TPA: filamentous hemagglutinin [Cyanobacteria bacterium UBA11369]|nr:filamentous hemagglutinin [Cyanobacteria bacterium UBA11369]
MGILPAIEESFWRSLINLQSAICNLQSPPTQGKPMKPLPPRFSFALSFSLFCLASSSAAAQIVPDASLPVNSSVTPQGNTSLIEGGTRAGGNLFHSFSEFSVPTGKEAHFNNALDIQNIFSRVTGRSISNIDGLIRANGGANLFLLNPNGIIFGPNARLDIGGSFLASTASGLNFADGTFFSANASQTQPLLTISVPIGLQYGANPGRILVQGSVEGINDLTDTVVGLKVQPNQTLALVGGDVAIEGGLLVQAGGRIELGSVAGEGNVSLNPIDKGYALGYDGVPTFGDIHLSGLAVVDASGEGGGDIQVRGRRLTLTDGSQISSHTLGAKPGGTVTVRTEESVELSGVSVEAQSASNLSAQVFREATGAGGNLILETKRLIIQDGARINTSTFGQGPSGTLSVTATESIEAIGVSDLIVDEDGNQVSSGIFNTVQDEATGAGGNLIVKTGRLIVRGGAHLEASALGNGAAGNLTVTATESVEVSDQIPSGAFSGIFTQTEGVGAAGNLTITTPQLTVGNGAAVSASSVGGTGAAGNLTINTARLIVRGGAQVTAATQTGSRGGSLTVNASEFVEVSGTGFGFSSLLTTSTFGTADAGNLTIETGRLIVRDGAQVQAATEGAGAGGTLTVRARELVELSGSGISADGEERSSLVTVTRGAGDAGDLTIETDRLIIRDRAGLGVNSQGSSSGAAGNLIVEARSILLDNGSLQALTEGGDRGNIQVTSQSLQLRRGSRITTNATGEATGGNIAIATGTLVALENSDISANADQASGGRVTINTEGIFGTSFRLPPILNTPESDITATSARGFEFSGVVEINTPDVDPSSGLIELPDQIVDVANLIDRRCSGGQQQSRFVVTGRGGLPPSLPEAIATDAIVVDWVTLGQESAVGAGFTDNLTAPTDILSKPAPKDEQGRGGAGENFQVSDRIVEATGWIIGANGEVILTASAPTSWQRTTECP